MKRSKRGQGGGQGGRWAALLPPDLPANIRPLVAGTANQLYEVGRAMFRGLALDVDRLERAAAATAVESLQIHDALTRVWGNKDAAVSLQIEAESLLRPGTRDVKVPMVTQYFDLSRAEAPNGLMTAASILALLTSDFARLALHYHGYLLTIHFKVPKPAEEVS